MRIRVGLIAAAVLPLGLLAGCTSSGGTSKQESTKTAAAITSPTALAAKLGTSLDALTSAHLAIDAGSLGGKSTADVLLQDGRATATDVHLTQGGAELEVITAGGKSYAKLPTTKDAAKPWVLVSPTSTNPVVKTLATSLSVADVTSSLSVVSGMVGSATGLQDKGTDTVNGARAKHYVMQLDPSKGTGDAELDGLLKSLGSTKLPVDLWLDEQIRPVKFTITISLGNAKLPVTVNVGSFNAPLTITAPPASDVSTG